MALAIVGLAIGAALAPVPPALVERWYSEGVYLTLQPVVTSISSLAPFALLDVLLAGATAWLTVRLVGITRASGPTKRAALTDLALDGATGVAVLYVVFLAMWGLNYQRLPLESRLDFDRRRVTGQAVEALALRAVDTLNRLDGPAHADPDGAATWSALRVRMAQPFLSAQRDLGSVALATPGRPKQSLLTPYFRWASVDGMVDPYGLEVIVNPDVTPMERPFVLAHEWGHLAGWAREGEASLVAWVTCLEGDQTARYSAWLSLYWHLRADVPRDALAGLDRALAPGPRRDLVAIRARLTRGAPLLRRASWRVYDQFLKANRVPEGIRSYDEIVTLVAGTATDPDGRPRLALEPDRRTHEP